MASSRFVGAGGKPSLGPRLCLGPSFAQDWAAGELARTLCSRSLGMEGVGCGATGVGPFGAGPCGWPGAREAVAHLAGGAEVHLSEEAIGPGEAVKVASPGQVVGLARAERSVEGAAEARDRRGPMEAAAVEVAMVGTQLAQMPSGVASYYLFLRGLLIDPAVVMTI